MILLETILLVFHPEEWLFSLIIGITSKFRVRVLPLPIRIQMSALFIKDRVMSGGFPGNLGLGPCRHNKYEERRVGPPLKRREGD